MNGAWIEPLFCWSLSARDGVTAATRESASLPEGEVAHLLEEWRRQLGGERDTVSLVYLGTCHRVEIYGSGCDPERIRELWGSAKRASLGSAALKTGTETLRHLIRVASSLESEVLGETQIAGQVRSAAERGRVAGLLQGPLDWAFQQALRVTKKIRHSARLGEGIVSVAHVAVDGLQDIYDDLTNKTALVVGAGSMAVQALQRLQRKGVAEIVWMNRTRGRIERHSLAAHCRLESFDKLHEAVWQHAIIVAATSSPEPVIRKESLKSVQSAVRRAGQGVPGPRVILDLGLPRNVDETLHGYAGFYVRNVDEFSTRAQENSEFRRASVRQAEEILERELAAIVASCETRERGPLVSELRKALEELKTIELGAINLENSADLEYLARTINAKLVHRLIEELEAKGEPVASQVLDTLVRAWRQPEQWLKEDLQKKNSPPGKKLRAKLVRVR